VGANGTILKQSGDGFVVVASGTFSPAIPPLVLYSPPAGAPLRGGTLVVTSSGAVHRNTGLTWTKPATQPPYSLNLTAFSFRDGVGVAVGTNGTVLRFDATIQNWNASFVGPFTASANTSLALPDLTAVWVYNSRRFVLAGSGGVLAESFPDTTVWAVSTLPVVSMSSSCSVTGISSPSTAFNSPFAPPLTSFPPSEEVWAVGCGGVYYRSVLRSGSQPLSAVVPSASWTVMLASPGAGMDYVGVFADRAGSAVVVGTSGLVYRYSNAAWVTFTPAASSVTLTSVLVSSAGLVTVAGTSATLLVSTTALPGYGTTNVSSVWAPSWMAPALPSTVPSNTTFHALSSSVVVGNNSVLLRRPSSAVSLDRPTTASPNADAFIGVVHDDSCSSPVLYDTAMSSSPAVLNGTAPALVFSYNMYHSNYQKYLCNGWPRLDARPFSFLEFRMKYVPTAANRTSPLTDLNLTVATFGGTLSNIMNVTQYVRGKARLDGMWRVVSIPKSDLLAGLTWDASNFEQITWSGVVPGDSYLVDAIQFSDGIQLAEVSEDGSVMSPPTTNPACWSCCSFHWRDCVTVQCNVTCCRRAVVSASQVRRGSVGVWRQRDLFTTDTHSRCFCQWKRVDRLC
jgi:hypothetical protein